MNSIVNSGTHRQCAWSILQMTPARVTRILALNRFLDAPEAWTAKSADHVRQLVHDCLADDGEPVTDGQLLAGQMVVAMKANNRNGHSDFCPLSEWYASTINALARLHPETLGAGAYWSLTPVSSFNAALAPTLASAGALVSLTKLAPAVKGNFAASFRREDIDLAALRCKSWGDASRARWLHEIATSFGAKSGPMQHSAVVIEALIDRDAVSDLARLSASDTSNGPAARQLLGELAKRGGLETPILGAAWRSLGRVPTREERARQLFGAYVQALVAKCKDHGNARFSPESINATATALGACCGLDDERVTHLLTDAMFTRMDSLKDELHWSHEAESIFGYADSGQTLRTSSALMHGFLETLRMRGALTSEVIEQVAARLKSPMHAPWAKRFYDATLTGVAMSLILRPAFDGAVRATPNARRAPC